ncbi:ABC-2 type transport system permease protein [Glycomyces sambucus]|uniref:ABC-2 type transport system permease protein n=1 Tax=Glycomyces sambucus TaxID=380244 RepID=A0A1G9FD56_9ACTN|nr:ABC transporter permease [Glycomyces sambucus]SDK86334.1 ABC-2 type transport system permease protein [Glycomyces sambucus]
MIAVLRQTMWSGWTDLRLVYTPTTWAFGWMVRVLCQVVFYSTLGTLLGDPDRTRFLLVGAAVFIAANETMMASASTTWERMSGTLSLLAAAPAGMVAVLAARSWFWIATGTLSSSIALLALAPFFGLRLGFGESAAAVALVFVTALTNYAVGLCCGSLALRFHGLRNVFANIALLTMTAFGGVMVPVAFWPAGLQWFAAAFPAVHGLAAVRLAIGGGSAPAVLAEAGFAFATAAGWLAVAAASLWWFQANARRTGSIDFGD